MPTSSEVFSPSDVENQIRNRVGRRIRDLQVIVHDHGLVLRGHVANFYLKQLAQQAAMDLGAAILTKDIDVS